MAIPAKPLAKPICSKSCLRPQIDAFVSYFALHTLRSTLYASHFPPHTSHFTPHTPEFPLHTLHTAFPTQHSTFFTLHTLHSTPFHIPQSAMRWYGSRGKWKNVQDCSNNLFHTSFLRDCIQVRCFFAKIQSAGARSPQNTAVIPAMFFAGATYKGAVQAKDVADDAN